MNYQEILKQIKKETDLTWAEIAQSLGYSDQKKVADIAHGQKGMSLPAMMALKYFKSGLIPKTQNVPKYTIENTFDDSREFVTRHYRPRFTAIVCDASQAENYQLKQQVCENEWLCVVNVVDVVLERDNNLQDYLAEMALLFECYTLDN